MRVTNLIQSAYASFAAAALITTMVAAAFFVLEPTVGQAVDSGPFTIRQTIDAEISFLVNATNTDMVGSINGLTGGNATGTTYAVVQTNNTSGYTMDISFDNQGPSMIGDTTGNTGIRDYNGSIGTPTYNFIASTSAQFAYTVNSSSTLSINFQDNGSSCGVSGGYTAEKCWKGPTTADYRMVDSDSSAASGATTTITFRVHVPSNPSPSLESDTYTATATLTALNKP